MGRLIFKSNEPDFSEDLVKVCEEQFWLLVEDNPKAMQLIQETTQNRDMVVEISRNIGLTTKYGAHWNPSEQKIALHLDDEVKDYSDVTPEQLRAMLQEDPYENGLTLLVELCNSANPRAAGGELNINLFENAEQYAAVGESIEFDSYRRWAEIVNYGIQHLGWKTPAIHEYKEDEFAKYSKEVVDNSKMYGGKFTHTDYYRDAFNLYYDTVKKLVDNLGTRLISTVEYHQQEREKLFAEYKQCVAQFNELKTSFTEDYFPKLIGVNEEKSEMNRTSRRNMNAFFNAEKSAVEKALDIGQHLSDEMLTSGAIHEKRQKLLGEMFLKIGDLHSKALCIPGIKIATLGPMFIKELEMLRASLDAIIPAENLRFSEVREKMSDVIANNVSSTQDLMDDLGKSYDSLAQNLTSMQQQITNMISTNEQEHQKENNTRVHIVQEFKDEFDKFGKP